MKELTQELVISLFDYENGRLFWKENRLGSKRSKRLAGCINDRKNGARYRVVIEKKIYYCSRVIFLWHHGYLPECIDHIDRNKLNDTIENLRAATKRQNNINKVSKKSKYTDYTGVTKFKGKYWCSALSINGKRTHLGYLKPIKMRQ